MIERESKFDNMSMSELKSEYVKLCFGAMIYGAKTESKRKEISNEIERREINLIMKE